ncbi:DNA-binding transcriptional response regulator, NtrC family, contains REC, AAA-type ATPase, and a Fis-type DNA-binding domains [Paraburkholderia diazotrophica]|uniref:DNA-binding transcriptional response regulator, NtrC family, contains REC, AAA-type ATPase, and a Fis-type DNA-binding domains n=2 Tax=Paraburkholderia diazotrophica TaxID=667676 RepID=A0A1H7E3T0_9BURK|nr:DNA-binding transcriptional response regulator, NtrC family, contains REC, AAA-type ATPase, and a Fis-type DNA-binding domains [Paraburkholderia diazotrophica]
MSINRGGKTDYIMDLKLKRLYHVCNPELACLDGNLPSELWRIRCIDVRERQGAALLADDRAAGLIEFSSLTIPDDLNEVDVLTKASAEISWVAVVTKAHLNDPEIRRIVRTRCVSYITLPAAAELIAQTIDRVYETSTGHGDERKSTDDDSPAMIGACAAMTDVRAAIRRACEHERPVMIVGESGSGKTMTATAIHSGSVRRDRPWVSIHCAAYAPERLAAELFGDGESKVEGGNRRSRLEMAEGGSLYIDGICELPLAAQQRLVDLLDSGPRNVRIICSTHFDLQRATEEHRLHPRLVALFAGNTITLPALRDRGADIRLLASWLLISFRSDSRHGVQGFSVCAWEALDTHTWPGNVQELINRVRRAIVVGRGKLISAADLGFDKVAQGPLLRPGDETDEVPEWAAVELAVARNQGRLDAAATELHISKVLLSRMLASDYKRVAPTDAVLRADSA